MTPSWYDVLDVEPTASADEIRSAWRAGIAELEPGSRRFQTLNQAAEVLLDEQRRSAYDAELAAQSPEPDLPEPAEAPGGDDLPIMVHDERSTGSAGAAMSGAGPRVVPIWVIAVVAVLTAAVVASSIFAWNRPQDRLESPSVRIIEVPDPTEEAGLAARDAAMLAIEPLLSYDYETLEADQLRAASYLTADYREEYDKLFALIEDNAEAVQPKVEANAFASAIVRSGEERVDVLLFVDQLTTNKGLEQPVTYKNQVTVTMQKVGQDWLIDNLVTSPAAQ